MVLAHQWLSRAWMQSWRYKSKQPLNVFFQKAQFQHLQSYLVRKANIFYHLRIQCSDISQKQIGQNKIYIFLPILLTSFDIKFNKTVINCIALYSDNNAKCFSINSIFTVYTCVCKMADWSLLWFNLVAMATRSQWWGKKDKNLWVNVIGLQIDICSHSKFDMFGRTEQIGLDSFIFTTKISIL